MMKPGTGQRSPDASAPLRVVIITQDDPFYLGECFEYLCSNLPQGVEFVACVISNVSPFGKKESFAAKALKTLRIFGPAFFAHYAVRYALALLNRKNRVEQVLARHGVKKLDIDTSLNAQSAIDTIKSDAPDLLVSIAGNEIFRRPLLDAAPLGCLNLHTALLPKYRGLMPSFWVLKNNEPFTGVSVFFVDEGIDSGPILVQKKIAIGNMSQAELIKTSKREGMKAIIEALVKVRSQDYELIDNDDAQMSYFGFPTADDVRDFKCKGKRFF